MNTKGGRFSKLVVIFCITFITLFTCFTCYICLKGGTVNDVLIEKVYDFFGLEVLALGGVKVSKNVTKTISSLKGALKGEDE